jgi:hypothetical protein
MDRVARDHAKAHGSPKSGPTDDARAAKNTDLCALSAEAGWPSVERSGDAIAVELGAGRGFIRAEVVRRPESVTARVRLASLEDYTELERAAVALLLLQVAGMVRLVRSSIWMADRGPEARLEVFLEPEPQASDLDHALSALSVAAALSSAEVGFLRADRAARMYLATRTRVEDAAFTHN